MPEKQKSATAAQATEQQELGLLDQIVAVGVIPREMIGEPVGAVPMRGE